MKFKSFLNYEGDAYVDRSYPKTEPKYAQELDKETGLRKVVKVGVSNVYLQKQEALPETLIYNLIDRYERTGDSTFLGQSVEGFIDTLSLPGSLMDAENLRVKAEGLFNALPLEERAKYNNNLGAFLSGIDTRMKETAKQRALEKRKSVVEGKEISNEQ